MLKIKLYSLDIIKIILNKNILKNKLIILNKNKKIILINKKDFIAFEKELKLLYYNYKILNIK
jgi:PHD/YefM family antitoxin component YafN of YafNO toxin-antitoxin module